MGYNIDAAMKIPVIAAVALLGLMLISGCAPNTALPKTAQIKIEKIDATDEWRPSSVTIAKGGKVTWTNTSMVSVHSVISGEGLFDEKVSGGESFSYTFTQNGTFTYHDEVYSSVGTIYVQ